MQNDELLIRVTKYDLAATLKSGQAFRWEHCEGSWEGVISKYWVRLRQVPEGVLAKTAVPASDWSWLIDYLQANVKIDKVLATFPSDPAMQASAAHCQGLRLLRQESWECLASFILSSTKQIVQIQQIVALLCQRFGNPVTVPYGHAPVFSFPSADRLAEATEAQLRECKMGFRAPNLLRTARMVAQGEVDLERIRKLDLAEARAALERLPGVGSKIANCVLLFAYGFQGAFPVDVWVMKALRQLYFPRRRPNKTRLLKFTATYFGPNAGYAQQYLFHYMRTREKTGISVLNRRGKKREISDQR
jgi:N-glycosylase/DNA lyase